MDLLQYMIDRDRGGVREPFRIPTQLHGFWKQPLPKWRVGPPLADQILGMGAPATNE